MILDLLGVVCFIFTLAAIIITERRAQAHYIGKAGLWFILTIVSFAVGVILWSIP